MKPRVSVIVPVYNAGGLIRGCMASLDAQTLDADDYEVIVVDDGSSDGTAAVAREAARTARARVTVLEQPQNRGPAAARNAGLAAARAPVIAFTDADCEAAPDWLERALARLEDDEVAAVEGKTEPKGTVGTLTHQMHNPTGGHWMTCNMVYRREALDATGGFDERFRLAFLEDSDVAMAVQENGGAIAWAPEVLVHHLVLPEGRRKFLREARKRFYNPLLYRKHPDLYARHIQPVIPALPALHVRYMAGVVIAIGGPIVRLPGLSVFAGLYSALQLKRLAHAYRARDPVSLAQVAVHPFVQTFWALAGAIEWRAFSFRL